MHGCVQLLLPAAGCYLILIQERESFFFTTRERGRVDERSEMTLALALLLAAWGRGRRRLLEARFSLSKIKIYGTSWIKRINKIYQKYRTKFKKKLIFFSKNL
jgi:hypothetical protein